MRARYITIAFACAAALLTCVPSLAAEPSKEVISLYDGPPPGSENWKQQEMSVVVGDPKRDLYNSDTVLANVTKPTLTVVRPEQGRANGVAVIVVPGGGFRVLSWDNEGTRIAQWLVDHGFTAFILKYRLHEMPGTVEEFRRNVEQVGRRDRAPQDKNTEAAPPPVPASRPPLGPVELLGIADGERAVQLVRGRAASFGIDPKRIGIIGFSAGGMVAGGATVRLPAADRPAFVGMIYSSIPDEVPAGSPPAFFAAAADDQVIADVPQAFMRWRASGAAAELHIYAKGQHGFATRRQGLPVDGWLDVFHAWLKQQGFVPARAPN